MKDWHKLKPELFKKQPYYLPGCDTYQLLGIEYGPAPFITTEAEAAAAVFVFGDFNEPSEHGWTDAAAAAGQQPVKVNWPTTVRPSAAGFIDTYQAIHADPVAKPAFTWTPRGDETDPEDHHDRIDFAFARAPGLTVRDAAIVGEIGPRTDLAVDPWPSDHRATLAEVRF